MEHKFDQKRRRTPEGSSTSGSIGSSTPITGKTSGDGSGRSLAPNGKHFEDKQNIQRDTEVVDGKQRLILRIPVGRIDLEDEVSEEEEKFTGAGKQEKGVSVDDAKVLRKRMLGRDGLKRASASASGNPGEVATATPSPKKLKKLPDVSCVDSDWPDEDGKDNREDSDDDTGDGDVAEEEFDHDIPALEAQVIPVKANDIDCQLFPCFL